MTFKTGMGVPLAVLFFRRPRHDSRLQRRLFQWWHRGVCRILGVQVVLQGSPGDDGLVVANHISYLDPMEGIRFRGSWLESCTNRSTSHATRPRGEGRK